jgi:hypothetical protein
MDERSRRFWRWFNLVWLPLALLIMVPVVILLGVSYYVRAVVVGTYGLICYLLRVRPSLPPNTPTQPPHVFDISYPVKKNQE